MDRQQDQAEAERLLCALVTVLDAKRPDIRGHAHNVPGHWDATGEVCVECRAWRQARFYVWAIQEGREADAQPAATVPTFDRCRTCQSYRANYGESDGHGVMEYCADVGPQLIMDGLVCYQYIAKTQP
jgi:hypothetical protein